MRLQEVLFWLWALWVFTGGIPTLAAPTEVSPPAIVAVNPGTPGDPKSDHLLYYEDGTVGFLKNHALKKLRAIEDQLSQSPPAPGRVTDSGLAPAESTYEPSVIDGDQAKSIFLSMNRKVRRRSQCFNRALVWGYEAWKTQNLKSLKVFMFFTSKYIREYHYKWWFHASPLALVQNEDKTEERVLDRYFMKGPVDLRTWSDYFITPKTPCKTAETYSDYRDHQEENYCYFIKVPMYFWQPRDIEARDKGNPHPLEFIQSEVEAAYRQGFP